MIVIVFSRDRALQLDATLRSMLRHAPDAARTDVCVLYTTSDQRHEAQYERLRADLSPQGRIRFVREQDFRRDLMTLLAPFQHVLFLVDDNLFVRSISLESMVSALEADSKALGFSLRLGENTTYCYMKDAPQRVPEMSVVATDVRRFEWISGDYDFGNPLELSSSMYRVSDLFPYLAGMNFRNPNTLEAEMDVRKSVLATRRPYLLSPPRSAAFCLPLNKVQDVAKANRAINDPEVSADSLAKLFAEGWRVNIEHYDGFVPRACHDEVDFDLVRLDDSKNLAEPPSHLQATANTSAQPVAPLGLRPQENGHSDPRHRPQQRHPAVPCTFAENPLVSVIIPTYNRPEMLAAALRSVCGQTRRNLEVIVVNDGGYDVQTVVDACNDNRIEYIVQGATKGASAARNLGIRAARGKYIAFLDDDDQFYPHHLETALAHLSDAVQVVYTDSVRATLERRNENYQLIEKRVPYCLDYDRRRLLVGNIAPINCFVFRRDLIEECGLFDESFLVLEDWEFWLRLAQSAPFHHVNEPTVQVNWRTDGSSVTATRRQQFASHRSRIEAKHRKELEAISTAERTAIHREFRAIWSKDGRVVQPLVSIIILVHNALDYLKLCAESLKRHTSLPHEVIFVDNGSSHETKTYLEYLVQGQENYHLIRNEQNIGFAAGNNQGLATAEGWYTLLLNSDVVLTPGWLERLVNAAESDPTIGIVGPMTNSTSGPQAMPVVNYDTRTLDELDAHANQVAHQFGRQYATFWRAVGFCLLIRREVVDKIGGLDTRFGKGNFEDDDFCLRAAIAGFKTVIARDCFVHHFGGSTFKANGMDHQGLLVENWEIFKEKWNIAGDIGYYARLAYDYSSILRRPFSAEHCVQLGVAAYDGSSFNIDRFALNEKESHNSQRFIDQHDSSDGQRPQCHSSASTIWGERRGVVDGEKARSDRADTPSTRSGSMYEPGALAHMISQLGR